MMTHIIYMTYQLTEEDIQMYLIKNYNTINQYVIKCVIIQILITQEVRNGFKSQHDAFESIDNCACMYISPN
jgi:hypothetical protein